MCAFVVLVVLMVMDWHHDTAGTWAKNDATMREAQQTLEEKYAVARTASLCAHAFLPLCNVLQCIYLFPSPSPSHNTHLLSDARYVFDFGVQ